MKTTFLNHTLDEDTPSYGDRDQIKITSNSQISDGDTANSLTWKFSINHIGTHIDVPRHFYDSGKTITDIEPDDWIFQKIGLIDIPCEEPRLINTEDLQDQAIDEHVDLLLIRTGYESFRHDAKYWQSYPGISPEMCLYLRKTYTNLRGIGFDFISLTSQHFKDEGKKAHKLLLNQDSGNFILIIEDMKLNHLDFTPDKVVISPMLVRNADGSPVTIFALKS